MKDIAKAIVIVGCSAVGVAGMYFKVDGAGWLVALAVLVAL